jgi:hypothetical protein
MVSDLSWACSFPIIGHWSCWISAVWVEEGRFLQFTVVLQVSVNRYVLLTRKVSRRSEYYLAVVHLQVIAVSNHLEGSGS